MSDLRSALKPLATDFLKVTLSMSSDIEVSDDAAVALEHCELLDRNRRLSVLIKYS